MKDRHNTKISKLTAEMVAWRDSTLAPVVRTKSKAGNGSSYTTEFEHCARGLLSTGMSATVCVGALTRSADYFLEGKARNEVVIPKKDWFSKLRESVGYIAWLYAAIEIAGALFYFAVWI